MEAKRIRDKWRKVFANKRLSQKSAYTSKDGSIKLDIVEQQELLDDIESLMK